MTGTDTGSRRRSTRALVSDEVSTTLIPSRVLLVDDEVDARELLASMLRDSGYEVDEAGDGREALAAIGRQRPTVLVTDCNMPHMSGNELVEALAVDPGLCSIPAIVISSQKQPPLPANVVLFLAKPFRIRQLRDAIRECLA